MNCNKKGLFVIVDKNKLCSKCAPVVKLAVEQHIAIYLESEKIVANSKNFDTKISRCDVILSNLAKLKDYQQKGYNFNFNISEKIEEYVHRRKVLIDFYSKTKVDEALKKAELAKTKSSKINNINKVILFLKDLEEKYGVNKTRTINKLLKEIHSIELEDLILKAEKEEFKGNIKKAIDKYQDILFFLTNDDIKDSLQKDEFEKYETKIKQLQSLL